MFRLLVMLLAFFVGSSTAHADKNENPFRVEAADATVAPGDKGVVQVTVRVPKEHHLYRDMMSVGVVTAEGVTMGEASFPPGFEKPDPADPETTREQYDMDVVIDVPVTAPQTPGVYPITLSVQYQGCKKSLCWMPRSDEIQASVKVQ